MSATYQRDLAFNDKHREFVAWWKRAHDLEFRQGLHPRIAWLVRTYRDEFDAEVAARSVIEVAF